MDGNKKSGNTVSSSQVAAQPLRTTQSINRITMVSPHSGDTIAFQELISLKLRFQNDVEPDSMFCFINGEPIEYKMESDVIRLKFDVSKAGRTTLKLIAYYDGEESITTRSVIALPTKRPQLLEYRVVKSYKHNPRSYTQGLFHHNGMLYEGTGQYGGSALQKVDIASGKIIESVALESRYFGEGITLLKGKIYQLTWQSGIGFIYDIDTFKQESSFRYFTQGWGITTMDDRLVMSDGSHNLYVINPNGFNVERQLEVYDHKGAVININELEYVNGVIWANVWLTDRIIGIDPKSGVVLYSLDMSGLLSANERARLDEQDEVLNGIAYNTSTGNFYITGKHWPKLFEIRMKR